MDNIEDLVSRLASEVKPIRPVAHPFVIGIRWIAIGACYLVVALAWSGLRADWTVKIHDAVFLAEIVSLLAIYVSMTLVSALLSFPDAHQKEIFLYAAPLGLILLMATLAWQADRPPFVLPVHSFECTVSILAVALLPSVWSFYFMRRNASTRSDLAGCNVLLASFSLGALWLRLHEETDSIRHVVEWHYLPMLAIGILGLWMGKKILKW